MVKTSDFESENSGSSPGEAASLLAAFNALLEKAFLITGGPPFHMGADEEFAKLAINGDTATLAWPEMQSGYYNDSYLETQHCSFPAWMLERPLDEIKAWKADEKEKYESQQRLERQRHEKQKAERQTALELEALAMLKAKYGG